MNLYLSSSGSLQYSWAGCSSRWVLLSCLRVAHTHIRVWGVSVPGSFHSFPMVFARLCQNVFVYVDSELLQLPQCSTDHRVFYWTLLLLLLAGWRGRHGLEGLRTIRNCWQTPRPPGFVLHFLFARWLLKTTGELSLRHRAKVIIFIWHAQFCPLYPENPVLIHTDQWKGKKSSSIWN